MQSLIQYETARKSKGGLLHMPGNNKNYEDLLKYYIESEIVNYNYHKHLKSMYEADKEKAYRDMSVLPSSSSSSIIKMPEKNYNSQEARNKQIGLYIDDLDVKIAFEQKTLDTVDTWLSECCRSYKQEEMIRMYMIDNQCSDLEKVAKTTGFCVSNIKDTKKRVINRIISKFFQ